MNATLSLLLCLLLTLPAAGGSKVTFRDDHTLLVDGKPFFPIGLYYCAEEFEDKSDRLLKKLKDHGFNTLGYYRWGVDGWKSELDRAHQLGLKVWIRGHNGLAIDSPEIEKAVLDQVRRTCHHPALLFWEFQDEPILNKVSVDGSRKGYRLVKREDPDHPMLVVEWPGAVERMHQWKGIGDIFATDLYPIPRSRKYGRLPNHDITQMRDYIVAIRKAHGDRPVLLVLQAWAWDPLVDGEKGYPPPHESRFMAYQAVIHGAVGIHYYGQLHCTRPNSASALDGKSTDPKTRRQEFEKCLRLNNRFWERHRDFFRELSSAARIFTLRQAAPDRRVTLAGVSEGSTIEILTKESDGQLYLLTANAAAAAGSAMFRLPKGVSVTEIHVLFENRKLRVKENGTFIDEFKPYDVHVYATKASLPR
ncbi:MAG TPA: hypothetical protein VKD72_13545 [Gemmataceae bacterium]|nr:hypothetical protein [Gemmataceae bacterium]